MVVLYSIRANCSGQDMLIIGAKACQVHQQGDKPRPQTAQSCLKGIKVPFMKSYGGFENSQQAWKGLAACCCWQNIATPYQSLIIRLVGLFLQNGNGASGGSST